MVAAPPAFAGGPPSDIPGGALTIPAGPYPALSPTVDVTDATTTQDPPHPTCTNSGQVHARSVWFAFTPDATGRYSVAASQDGPTGTTVPDTVLAIYTSGGGAAGPFTEVPTNASLTSVGCDDDSADIQATQSRLTTDLVAGTTYWMVVWQFADAPLTPAEATVQLRINPESVDNDDGAAARTLRLNQPEPGTQLGAANDYTLSGASCFSGLGQTTSSVPGRDVVYRFVAPADGTYGFRASQFTGADPVLFVAGSLPAASGSPQDATHCLGASNRTTSKKDAAEEMSPLTL